MNARRRSSVAEPGKTGRFDEHRRIAIAFG